MRWSVLGVLSLVASPAFAVLMDCEERADGSFHCVEVKDGGATDEPRTPVTDAPDAATTAAGAAAAPTAEAVTKYRDQAEAQCEYKKPRRRSAVSMGKAPALQSEGKKKARKAYEKCVEEQIKTLSEADR